ncbi:hypothetical protein NE237_002169 [Protea cynaroides]|uniref:Uncharacterized protein n=1 Tax=Protea cynaroides TaxID=273540 RepID=A0A9Q0KUH7_9MAGN|nr:hypothetical protein NE237_002169 [Protea cynaroides]
MGRWNVPKVMKESVPCLLGKRVIEPVPRPIVGEGHCEADFYEDLGIENPRLHGWKNSPHPARRLQADQQQGVVPPKKLVEMARQFLVMLPNSKIVQQVESGTPATEVQLQNQNSKPLVSLAPVASASLVVPSQQGVYYFMHRIRGFLLAVGVKRSIDQEEVMPPS